MTEHAYLDAVTGFVLGTLGADEERQLLDHLAEGCSICEEAQSRLEPTRYALAASAPPRTPPPELKRRVLAAVRRQPQEPGQAAPPGASSRVTPLPARPNRLAWAMAAVLVIAVGTLSIASWRLRVQRENLREQLAAAEQALQDERSSHQADLASRDEYLDLLLDPGAVCVDFDRTPDAPTNLRGKATYDPATRRAVIALDNATLPASQAYELWAIRGGTPVSLGVIGRAGDGTATVYLRDVGSLVDLGALAVSLEPAGGSPQSTPTGPVVLVASLGG